MQSEPASRRFNPTTNKTRFEKSLYFGGLGLIRVSSFLKFYRIGKAYGYPTCCVAHWSFDAARGDWGIAIRRGSVYPPNKQQYVPCAYHMRRHPNWAPFRGHPHQQFKLF